jgi:serine/threonine protein kinase
MSQRFVRCPHCGTPHDAQAAVCPTTGKRMRVEGRRPASDPPPPQKGGRGSPPPSAFTSSAPSAPEPLGFDEPSLIGQVLGNRYRILSILGSGGMGVVYEAEHLGLERSVAVKVLNPLQAKKKNTVKRFQQEARAAGGIGHPNICEVYDMGWLEDGCPYLVMERLHGQTLADRIRKSGGLPFLEAVEVLSQVLAGLMAAHEKGIMHRDIKPENIFLSRRTNADPVAKILDFGVSKGMAGGAEEPLDLTRTGMVMGTPYYMSPEQARGERNLDARVDVYACGVMLYECLTGRRPFLAPNYNALLLQILTENPRPARDLRPDLPAAFEPIMRRSMARARDDRYSTAASLRRDLLQVGKQLGQPKEASAGRRIEDPQEVARHAPEPQREQRAPAPYAPAQPQAQPQAPAAQPPRPVAPHVRPAAGAPAMRPAAGVAARSQAPGVEMPGPMVTAPTSVQLGASGANPNPRHHTVRMAAPPAPPAPPSHEEKRRAPIAGASPRVESPRPDPRKADSTDNLPKLFDTSPSSDGTPSPHIRPHPAPALRRPTPTVALVSPQRPQAPMAHARPAPAQVPAPPPRSESAPRKAEAHDFSDAPTYVISRDQILGDFLKPAAPVPAPAPARAPARPVEISDWDAETTVTTAPPEWESDTSDDSPAPAQVIHNVEETFAEGPRAPGALSDERIAQLRRQIEDEYGDLPLDDATLVHRAKPPRRQ